MVNQDVCQLPLLLKFKVKIISRHGNGPGFSHFAAGRRELQRARHGGLRNGKWGGTGWLTQVLD
ncbi:hypothetical protein [Sandarakinorhabdus cyanobacteriorum]|uniref:hypothetical protein n=1 Tax=Sandarakinorhabdus cyanobacteriorum TaxID=1981098 RepID=UPI001055A195|nr:hypothetical protein [Sandarakinorhabdus cyanobacteriorum]